MITADLIFMTLSKKNGFKEVLRLGSKLSGHKRLRLDSFGVIY